MFSFGTGPHEFHRPALSGKLIKTQITGATSRISDSVDLGGSPSHPANLHF